MTEVVLAFLDGELLHGAVGALQLDEPFLEVELHGLDGNNRQALVPAAALRQVEQVGVPALGQEVEVAALPRVALHFQDGQVFRAHVVSPAVLQRHGAVWDVVEAGTLDHRIFAIPYSALKSAFYVRHWDTRRPQDRGGHDPRDRERARLAEIMSRRSRAAVSPPEGRPSGLLARLDQVEEGRKPPPEG